MCKCHSPYFEGGKKPCHFPHVLMRAKKNPTLKLLHNATCWANNTAYTYMDRGIVITFDGFTFPRWVTVPFATLCWFISCSLI